MKKIFTLLTLLLCAVTSSWADADITYALTSFTEDPAGTCTYEFDETKFQNKTVWVEVPSASVSGTIYFKAGNKKDDRFLYIYKINGTVQDDTRKVSMPSGWSTGIDYTSDDVLTNAGKYYLVFSTTNDWKCTGIKYTYVNDPSNLTITDEGFYVGSVSVTMSAASGFDIYYTTNGTTPTNESTPYTGAINVTATTTIKAIAYNSSTTTYGAVKTATYTIVGDYVKYDFTAPTAADLAALRANTSAWTDDTNNKYIKNAADWSSNTDYALEGSDGTDISVANGLLFGRSGNTVSAGSARYYYEVSGVETYYFYLNNGSCYIKVPNVAAGQQVVITMSAGGGRTISADNATPASYSYSSSDGIKSYAFTATKSGTISINNSGGGYKIYSIEVRSVKSVPVGATGWSTYSTDKALDFTGLEIEAYQVTGYSGTAITKSKIDGTVAANTGLLVKGTPSTNYNVPVVASGTDYSATNKMVASVSGGTVSAGVDPVVNYVLMKVGDDAVFQWIGTTSATLGANKAYLSISGGPKPAGARGLSIDDEVTAIKNIKVGTEDNVYYDLNGRRVLYPTKGLYIVNGKKIVVK